MQGTTKNRLAASPWVVDYPLTFPALRMTVADMGATTLRTILVRRIIRVTIFMVVMAITIQTLLWLGYNPTPPRDVFWLK